MKYENRFVAFVDILGFKSLLKESVNGEVDVEDKISDIIAAYQAIRDIWDLDGKLDEDIPEPIDLEKMGIELPQRKDTRKVSLFSDCLVVSVEIGYKSEIWATLLQVQWLIMALLSKGMVCRGAVALGKLIHTDEYLFGPALAEAYLLESKAALYPRVILDRTIIRQAFEKSKSTDLDDLHDGMVKNLLKKDSDGMHYIDYFSEVTWSLDSSDMGLLEHAKNLRHIIVSGLKLSADSNKSDVRVKYLWMKEKYNVMIDDITSDKALSEQIRCEDWEFVGWMRNLPKIHD